MTHKKTSLICCFLLAMQIAYAEQATPVVTSNAVPNIKFETEVIDYGTIEKGADQERTFKFMNSGYAPLILTAVNSSCGCLVAKWASELIALENPLRSLRITIPIVLAVLKKH